MSPSALFVRDGVATAANATNRSSAAPVPVRVYSRCGAGGEAPGIAAFRSADGLAIDAHGVADSDSLTGVTVMPSNRRHMLTAGCAGALLAGAALAAPVHADPGYPPSFGSNGAFGVTTTNDPRANAHIPPGIYRVEQAPSMFPYQSAAGFWLRCNNFPCTPQYPANIIASGDADRNNPTFVTITPTDVGVSLANVTLTRAN